MLQDKTHSHTHDHAAAPAGSTHGHVILKWLAEEPLSVDALRNRVAGELGSAPQFHTCDRQSLSLDGLLELLSERGKIVASAGGWSSDMSKVCADA